VKNHCLYVSAETQKMHCRYCGSEKQLEFPIELSRQIKVFDEFEEQHKSCVALYNKTNGVNNENRD